MGAHQHVLCSHRIWPALESFTERRVLQSWNLILSSPGLFQLWLGKHQNVLLALLNWLFLTLGKTRSSIMPNKAALVSLLVNAALEKEISSWVQCKWGKVTWAGQAEAEDKGFQRDLDEWTNNKWRSMIIHAAEIFHPLENILQGSDLPLSAQDYSCSLTDFLCAA